MRIIVRNDIVDDQPADEAGTRGLDRRGRRIELLPARQQRRAVRQRPAIILDMGDFEPFGAELHGKGDDLFKMFEILPVNDRVDGQRKPHGTDEGGSFALGLLRAGKAGDAVPGSGIGILQAELDMFEPGVDQVAEAKGVEPDAGRDQVDVEPTLVGMAHELNEVAANQRLASGKMHLQDAQCRRLVEHPYPRRRVELGAGALEIQRVRAIRTSQRAAMRQLGEQSQRRLDINPLRRGHCCSTFLSTRSCSIGRTSPAMTSRGASYRPASSSMIASASRLPSISRRISTACSSGNSSRSGARTIHVLRTWSKRNLT